PVHVALQLAVGAGPLVGLVVEKVLLGEGSVDLVVVQAGVVAGVGDAGRPERLDVATAEVAGLQRGEDDLPGRGGPLGGQLAEERVHRHRARAGPALAPAHRGQQAEVLGEGWRPGAAVAKTGREGGERAALPDGLGERSVRRWHVEEVVALGAFVEWPAERG